MLPIKTDLPQGTFSLRAGSRRSFFCRIKCKIPPQAKESSDTAAGSQRRKKHSSSDKKYKVIQCTGYLKSWAPAKIGLEEQETDTDCDAYNLSCLIAIGRAPRTFQPPNITISSSKNPNLKTTQFISRHAPDGIFLYIDSRFHTKYKNSHTFE